MTLGDLITVELAPARTHVFRRRLHHGTVGLALLLVPDWRARILGIALIVHDLDDRCAWIRDLVKHPEAR